MFPDLPFDIILNRLGKFSTKTELKQAQRRVKQIIAWSAEKRREHNTKVAEIHALIGEITAEQAMKAITNAEDVANMWRKSHIQTKENKTTTSP